MPKLKDMFPSAYLSGDDLDGKSYVVTISHVKKEEMFDKRTEKKTQKWVLYFKGSDKGVLLGKETSDDIAEIVGDSERNTDNWIGKKVEIYPTIVKAFGEDHNVVRYRKPTPKPPKEKPVDMPTDIPISMKEKTEPEKVPDGVAPPSTNPEVHLYDILESKLIQIELDDDPIDFITFTQNDYPRFNEIHSVVQRDKLEKFYQRLKVLFKQ